MAENFQYILGDEVILPHDLLPDDTKLIYDDNGTPVKERDIADLYDDTAEDIELYAVLALAHYNDIHHTDYKFIACTRLHMIFGDSVLINFDFTAAPSASVECKSSAKEFCSKLRATKLHGGDEVVTSCSIVDDSKIYEGCYRHMGEGSCKTQGGWNNYTEAGGNDNYTEAGGNDNYTEPEYVFCVFLSSSASGCYFDLVDIRSRYSQYLADGVTLSDKAKFRLPFILLALESYNKKQHTNYKLVDGLPYCLSWANRYGKVYHCNFIARQSAAAANIIDASNKLFFAEFKKRDGYWVLIVCCVVRGKTTAGCHVCPPRWGKRVIHPTRGFRYGLYPERLRGRR